MKITDVFIQRPVLAIVISLLIFLFGLRALVEMQVRQYPKTESSVIKVTTAYPGADAELIQGFITSPLQKAIASADGIDYLSSESSAGASVISAHLKLNFDPQAAFTDIMSKVAEVRGQLPRESESPVISKATDNGNALMYLSFSSDKMTPQQITDYVARVVTPKIETILGVGDANLIGGSVFAMRIWLHPEKLAAYNLTAADVSQALASNNFQTTAGKTEGQYYAVNIRANTDLNTPAAFGNIIIKNHAGAFVRLRDLARIELGAKDYQSSVSFNGKKAVFIGVSATPTANPLSVITRVRAVLPQIGRDLPPSMRYDIAYDATKFIRASIKEVASTIIEATLIVIIVIFLFLGSLRSVIIPIVTIPLSLVGVCAMMLALGYSINLLTLLAMVLAIGLVVDDAIVVVENIHRHIEEGMSPYHAALKGAKEIALPVIAMTITLAAVYAPIGFLGGITGALFKEFAFTLASAVIISGIVALTLTPMMCSKLLATQGNESKLAKRLDEYFARLKGFYQRRLHNTLNFRPVIVLLAITVLVSLAPLYMTTAEETAPKEDTGFFIFFGQAPEYATHDYVKKYSAQYQKIIQNAGDVDNYFLINGMGSVNSVLAGIILKPWDERNTNVDKYKAGLQAQVGNIAGLQTYVDVPSPLPGSGGGAPFNFVVTTTADYTLLQPAVEKLTEAARASGKFIFAANTLKFNKPEAILNIDRNKAAQIGISMQAIGQTLASSLAGGYVNRFNLAGRSYDVVPQLEREHRFTPEQLNNLYLTTASGDKVPLSTIATLSKRTVPNKLSQFQQLNSATIQGVLRPGVALGDAIAFMEKEAQRLLPQGMGYDFSGQSRQFMQEGSSLIFAFFFSVIIIFLVLAAQFESFRDPAIIIITVPLAICGALIFLNIGLATLNIYTKIGLITLIGLISKHGILMVEFANHLQSEKGFSIRQAIEEAAAVRLRPILMTTAAMVFGVLPLLLAQGAGAASRANIGLVITTGMVIGTLFTLFVIPVMYTYLAKSHQS